MHPGLIFALAAGEAAAPGVAPLDYSLPAPQLGGRIVEECRAAPGEILVCGRRGQGEREVEPVPPKGMETGPDVPDLGLDTPIGRIDPVIATTYRQDGWKDQRVMVRLKVPF